MNQLPTGKEELKGLASQVVSQDGATGSPGVWGRRHPQHWDKTIPIV